MDLTRLHRPDAEAWRWFVQEWHGRLSGYSPADLKDVRAPAPLLDYYEAAGCLPTANLHLVTPADLAGGGALRFVVEEQGVYSFETAADAADPPVWLVEDGVRRRLRDPLTRFLLQHALFEATIQGDEGGWGYAERSALDAIATAMPRLPLGSWPLSVAHVAFHAGTALIGIVWDSGGDTVEVWAAAKSRSAVAPLDALVEWDA